MQHATLTTEQVRALIARGKLRDTLFQALGIFFLGVGLIVIFLLVGDMVLRGAGRLNLDFFTQFASRRAGSAGILSAWVGSLLVMTPPVLVVLLMQRWLVKGLVEREK